MYINMTTDPAASRPRGESAFVLLGAGYGARRQAMWQQPMFTAGHGSDAPTNPIFTAVDAAKQGSPPREVFR